jgi:hypothetical protein
VTTTAYDTHFIASDIAFTDLKTGEIYLDIPFRKVKRVGQSVIGMAGCLSCMVDFSNMILTYIQDKSQFFGVPASIIDRDGSDFIAMIHIDGMCLKLTKVKDDMTEKFKVTVDNVTLIPTVIGSGGDHVQDIINDCPNAVVAVLEAIKRDKYTAGDVKYCSIKREDIHNLEVLPMSIQLQKQVTGLQEELRVTNDFLVRPENESKVFHASTETYYAGTPSSMDFDTGMLLLKQGFSKISDSLSVQ